MQVTNFACGLHLFTNHVATLSHVSSLLSSMSSAGQSMHQVSGPSMVPTMAITGEVVLELKWNNVHNLRRGDLVTYVSPLDPTRIVCKRITGMPGDTVCVDPTGSYAPSTEHVVVPKNHIWVTGDNLAWSRDSRIYGPVPLGLVRGRLYARVRPLSRYISSCSRPFPGVAIEPNTDLPQYF